MNNALFMAISACLRGATATGIVAVGGVPNAATSSVSGTVNSILFPAGAIAGDYLLLITDVYTSSSYTVTGLSGASTIAAANGQGASNVMGYFLTSADIAAGQLSLTISGANASGGVSVTAWRNVSTAQPLDVTPSAFADSAASEGPKTVTAPGLTTATDGSVVVFYAAGKDLSNPSDAYSTPTGFALLLQDSTYFAPQIVAYQKVSPSGSVAATSTTYAGTNYSEQAAGLIALRAYNPVFRMTGTLPAGTVGTAYNGTLTLAGIFTAPVTISGLASWMTYSVSGTTVTIGGTPTTAETDSFTPVATDANGLTATGPTQSVVVGAAPTGFTDNFASSASASNWTMALEGTAGTYAFNAGNAQLNPVFQKISNVSMRHSGTFKNLAATIAVSPLYFNANPDYLVLTLGTGALANQAGNTSSWWFTTLANGYYFELHNGGMFYLYKMVNGVATQLATTTISGFTYGNANVFELKLSGTGVVCKLNGTAILTSSDTTYASGGDILIAQGSYTTGNGGQSTITQVTAS